ncbi:MULTISPECIES: cycloisomerase [unclassified Sinorhizobium]|uniref:cycloisomerase n=1 Tax=unclassified Sinorhizobium TaxID=2613772 RepID=UPI0024C36AA9|nr:MULTISPECIES: cycloisomerase [unclassified Sinorhizobium]MDK1373504.1 cycloisomerase [Sinorhizobium sp. 6-70]MDK1479739.1 cycloisomerase [Sinorhizobium sp. 6-117]
MRAGIILLSAGFTLAASIVIADVAAPGRRVAAESIREFAVPEANQGVGVDADHFYAVDNRMIAKYDKASGERVAVFEDQKDGPIKHLNSAVVVEGEIYAAHSNFPDWPAANSVEVFDAATMQHLDTYALGIDRGFFTWLDYHDGSWWGAFANYNRKFGHGPFAYGNKDNTQVVRFDRDWRIAEAWVLPHEVLEKFGDMSNSGGSWGPGGRLYLTGHDAAEAYVMERPETGSVLKWIATVPLKNTGQGIAWDRSTPDVLYGISRGESPADNHVTVSRMVLGQQTARSH